MGKATSVCTPSTSVYAESLRALTLDGLSVTLLVLGVHIGVAVLVVAVHIIAVSVRSLR